MRAGDAVYALSSAHDKQVNEGLVGNGSGGIVADDVPHSTGQGYDEIRVFCLQKPVAVGKEDDG